MSHYLMLTAVVLVAVLAAVPSAQAATVNVRQYNEHEGLPARQAYDVCIDSLGYLWAFTATGVSRFDGTEFRTYPLRHLDRTRNYALFLSKLRTMPDGAVALSFSSGQVLRYDAKLDRFEPLLDLADKGIDARLNNFAIHGDTIVMSTSDGVYIGTPSGIRRIGLAGKMVGEALPLSATAMLAGTDHGLYRLATVAGSDRWSATLLPGTEGKSFAALCAAGDKILAGTQADNLWVVESGGNVARKSPAALPGKPIWSMAPAAGGRVLVAVDGAGVYEIDAEDESVKSHICYENGGKQLSANTVSDICLDGDGGFWVSTTTHGINHVDNRQPVSTVIRHDADTGQSLSADCVNVVFEDADGDLWFGSDAGLSLLRNDGTWSHFLNRTHGIDSNILTIEQGPDGTIYAGGYGSGAWSIDKATGSVRRFPSADATGAGVGTDYVFDIFCENGNIWFGGIQGLLTRYDTATGTYSYYPCECVGNMAVDRDGTVYVTGCGGLGIMPRGSTLTWTHDLGGMTINTSRDAVYDPARHELWIATEAQGIIRYDIASGKASAFDPGQPVDTDDVYGLAMDRGGNIWFYTEHDVFEVDVTTGHVRRITPLLNLDDISLIQRSMTVARDGRIVVGSIDGAIVIDPTVAVTPPHDVRLIISDISVNHKKLDAADDSDILAAAPDAIDRLTLTHRQNTLSVHFSALYFGNNKQIAYRWRLNGFDNQWQSADGARDIVLRNLPTGHYRLEIEAENAVTGEKLAERTLRITVLPPPWLSWWAIMIYVVIAAAVIMVAVNGFRRRQREQRITDKIHSFLDVINDLHTPVTLIKAPLGEIERQPDLPEATHRNAGVAMENVEKLLGIIGRLLDLRHESQHSDCLNLANTDLREFVGDKVAEWRPAAVSKGLKLESAVADDMGSVMIDRNKISHILDNLISNAIKYTFRGEVRIEAKRDRKCWHLIISDTGVGIPRNGIRHLFRREYRSSNSDAVHEIGSGMGVLIAARLCRLHKGKIKVVSEENRGTQFILSFPLSIRNNLRILPEALAGPSSPAEPTAPADTAPDTAKETVVLIDSERDILDYLSQNLSDTYNVVTFDDAAAALGQIESINPGIVVTEARLSGMSGFELCRKLKTSVETSHIPVVFLSGLSERQNIILGLESGANDYIVKPFDVSVLRLRLQIILKSRHQLQTQVRKEEEQTSGDDEIINGLDKEFIEKVRRSIDDNIGNSEFTTQSLCELLGMSRTTVFNKIKALTGESINEFIRTHRLNKAQELLRTRRYNISEVAYMVGFTDPKYFSTCFKKQFGVSPSKLQG